MASAYERARLVNIARNEAKLRELNIGAFKNHIREQQEFKRRQRIRRKRKAPSTSPTRPLRRSRRAKRQPPPALYTAHEADEERKQEESQRQKEMSNGWRNNLGVWRGERFGEVPGVPVGTVFGSGDYQRVGRFECRVLDSSNPLSPLNGLIMPPKRSTPWYSIMTMVCL